MCSCLYRQYHYLSIVQSKLFRPSSRHSATESRYFRFILKICSRSALAGGGLKNLFRQCPKPLSASPTTNIIIMITTITIVTILDTSFYCDRILLAASIYLCFGRYCSLGLCYNCVKHIANSVKLFFCRSVRQWPHSTV